MAKHGSVCLRLLLSASLVTSMFPAPALAEMLGAEDSSVTALGEVPKSAVEQEASANNESAIKLVEEEEAQKEEAKQTIDATLGVQNNDVGVELGEKDAELGEGEVASPTDDSSEGALLTVESDDYAVLQLDTPVNAAAESGSYWVAKFTAPEAGKYTFSSTGSQDTYGYLYSDENLNVEIARDDDCGEGSNFQIIVDLAANQTVYLKARPYNSSNALACAISVVRGLSISGGYAYPSGSETFLYNGQPQRPSAFYVYAYMPNYVELQEGTDYVVDGFEDAEGRRLDSAPVEQGTYSAILRGIGDYSGNLYARFSIMKPSISDYIFSPYTYKFNTYIVNGRESKQYDTYGSTSFKYLYTGAAISPTVEFRSWNEGDYVPQEGRDYAISYTDSNGDLVDAPTAVGDYNIVMTALDGGALAGVYAIPFSIVETLDLNELELDYELDTSLAIDGTVSSTRRNSAVTTNETADESNPDNPLAAFVWSLIAGFNSLIENLDFVVSTVRMDAYEHAVRSDAYSYNLWNNGGDSVSVRKRVYNDYDTYAVTLSGIGSYTGAVKRTVYTAATLQNSFNSRVVNNHGNAVEVLINEKGAVADTPLMRIDGLLQGVDYQVTEVVGAEGLAQAKFVEGDDVYVRVVGIGTYEGCERLVKAKVVTDSARYDMNVGVMYSIDNGYTLPTDSGESSWHLLRSSEPSVTVWTTVSGVNVRLSEGNGITSSLQNVNGDMAEVLVEPDGNSLVDGSFAVPVKLVDKFNLEGCVSGVYGNESSVSIKDGVANLTYGGVSYAPTPSFIFHEFEALPSYKVTLKNSKGTTVSKITKAGTYTMTLQGTGDWTGTEQIKLVVSKAVVSDDAVDLRSCRISVSDAVLENGKAEPPVSVYLPGESVGSSSLVEGVDYTVMYGSNDTVGKRAWALVTAIEGGKLYGKQGASFNVLEVAKRNIDNGYYSIWFVNPSNSGFDPYSGSSTVMPVYRATDGEACTPSIVVQAPKKGVTLTEADYDVEYGNNRQTGVAYVKVTGKGQYQGMLSANYYVLGGTTLSASVATSPVSLGATAVFRCTVINAGDSSVTYRWQTSADGGKKWTTISSAAAKKASFSVTAGSDVIGNLYRCVAIASDGRKAVSDAIGFSTYKEGWVDLPEGKKGYCKDGVLRKGWMDLDGGKFWFDADGAMALGWTDVVDSAGKTFRYYFNPKSGNLVRDTWFQIDGKTYYFRPSGNLATGWATIDDNGTSKTYYLDDDGQLVTGWRDIDNGQGKVGRYYFRPSGAMATGFVSMDGKTYLFRSTGSLARGWADVGGKKYYANDDGTIVRGGWLDLDGRRYYFRPSGAMATGWATVDGQTYWFRSSGSMAIGWADVDDAYKRYFDGEGHMATGWQTIGGKTYYFRASGAMQTGKATIDGKACTFSDKGVLIG